VVTKGEAPFIQVRTFSGLINLDILMVLTRVSYTSNGYRLILCYESYESLVTAKVLCLRIIIFNNKTFLITLRRAMLRSQPR
jgi:hypothetical protein